ncbi:MAG: AmmeMemoRadiSam system radical SAM enzyme [Victivallales bacterium]|nr:AmmeMemoRadiSam system radical SAM enzyme [Victivallales bacterium]
MRPPLYTLLPNGNAQCQACAHQCVIKPGGHGHCGQRSFNGTVFTVPRDAVSGLAIDPMEKKPLYHFLPGHEVLSYGTVGCSLACPFCQNWDISQVGRDERANGVMHPVTDEEIVALAVQRNAPAIAATYNEPVIGAEWTADIFELAHTKGIRTVLVSNGFASQKAVALLAPLTDAANIDLKAGTDDGYRQLGGRLQPVLNAITELHRQGVWLEITTLVVPGFNNTPAHYTAIAEFIASLSCDIPWHISAYFSTYKMPPSPEFTPLSDIETAVQCGEQAGLHHIYTGNLRPNLSRSDTLCPHCGKLLIQRFNYTLNGNAIKNGRCPDCGTSIAGVFD